jgi:hypothetical protein
VNEDIKSSLKTGVRLPFSPPNKECQMRLNENLVVDYAVTDAKKTSNNWKKYLTNLDKFLAYNLSELADLKKFWSRKGSQ